jgi:hypothetical protein
MAKRIVAVVGEYTNNEGQPKAEFVEIGVIVTGSNGKECVLLDPTISLSGVLAKQNALGFKKGDPIRDMVMSSVVASQPQQHGQPQQQGGYQQQSGYQRR